MTSSECSVDELVQPVEGLQDRVATLEAERERLRDENERLKETVEDQAETNTALKARLKRYDNAHTPPRKQWTVTLGGRVMPGTRTRT